MGDYYFRHFTKKCCLMPPIPLVYIIILNWNGWQDTLACVESCHKLTWPNFRILVVDNASTDGSEENLRQNLVDVEIIQSGANLGFAGGNNIGIRRALGCGADYVWLLNNDTVAEPQALSKLVEALESDQGVAMAGSKIYYFDDPRRIWSAAGSWRKGWLALRQKGGKQLDRGQFDASCTVWSISGCSLLVRAAAIEKIGLMDEKYFLYWEDTEWCARARASRYDLLYVSNSHIWHKVSASTRQGSFEQFYYYNRNGFYFLRQYDPLLLPVISLYSLLFSL
jgi:GT2 family glycosyltransferase